MSQVVLDSALMPCPQQALLVGSCPAGPSAPHNALLTLHWCWFSGRLDTRCGVVCRYERSASANAASSFSFAGDAPASGMHSTPRLPGSEHAAQHQDADYAPPDEAEGPVVLCHCGLACNKLEAKTEKNMGR